MDSYTKLKTSLSWRTRLRSILRDVVVFTRSLGKSIEDDDNWIRFPYYHHVFYDERQGFARQLRYMKNFGEFISLDQAIDLLSDNYQIDGRYFCVTFDDGLKSCYDNALPILVEHEISATFFIITDYTGEHRICQPLHSKLKFSYEYMTWDECAQMLKAGMTIGSHTCSHLRLMDLDEKNVRLQLSQSKHIIESKLGIECKHFTFPWGVPDKDFHPQRDINIAKEIGFSSSLTTSRGKNQRGCSPYAIKRDNTFANWGNYQLRYFLSL